MLLRTLLVAGLLALSFSARPAWADLYQWTDAEGKVHFTSDLTKVPARYRAQATAGAQKETVRSPKQSRRSAPGINPAFLEDLKKQAQRPTPTLSREVAVPEVPKVGPLRIRDNSEPQKYEYDCTDQLRTGRCRRSRRPEWDAWNARQKSQPPADAP